MSLPTSVHDEQGGADGWPQPCPASGAGGCRKTPAAALSGIWPIRQDFSYEGCGVIMSV